ncbi:MAG: flagellar motor switch protein FliN [Rhizobiaceae bacterium]
MTKKTAPEPSVEPQEQELNQAIEQLRGALREGAATELLGSSPVIMNIPVEVQVVLGSADMPVSDLMALGKGSVVSLNRRIGEQVDVTVNGRRIARGEITVLENDPSRFGVKLVEIITEKAR